MTPLLITTQQAAERLGLTTNALHELRCRDEGLPIVQKGLLVGYQLEDLKAFERREVLAILEQVLAAERPLPFIRSIAKAVMSAPVRVAGTPQPISNSPPDAIKRATSSVHRLDATQSHIQPLEAPTPPPATRAQSRPALSWYLVHTKPRQEAIAQANLACQGFECYLPMFRVEKIRQRKTALMSEPMFPRYLFIRSNSEFASQSWSPIRSTLGVTQLVRFGGLPAKVDPQLIDVIKLREQVAQPQSVFSQGDRVRVNEGPFAGLDAIYQTTDAQSRSMILLNILSKPVAMHIDTASLRKAG